MSPKELNNWFEAVSCYGQIHANHPTHKIGAALIWHNNAIYGANSVQTHPKSPKPYKTRCAEFSAVLRGYRLMGDDIAKATLIVARKTRGGRLALAKPCRWCEVMITKIGIKKVKWSE